jgi:hypothetical protein
VKLLVLGGTGGVFSATGESIPFGEFLQACRVDTLDRHRRREWSAAMGVGLTRERERELLVGA